MLVPAPAIRLLGIWVNLGKPRLSKEDSQEIPPKVRLEFAGPYCSDKTEPNDSHRERN